MFTYLLLETLAAVVGGIALLYFLKHIRLFSWLKKSLSHLSAKSSKKAKVSAIVPVSVIQYRAGGMLNHKNARVPPTMTAENAARSIWFWKNAIPAYAANYFMN